MKTRVRHCVVRLCCMLSAVGVLGCAAQQRQSMPMDARATNGEMTMPLCDETPTIMRWKIGGLDWATMRPSRADRRGMKL